MSILDSASSKTVYRGCDYYKEGNVISYTQLSDFEYEGEVQGTNKNPYHVKINIRHPKNSICDCSYADGNRICKHMVAVLFAVSKDDLKDYESLWENDYEDEYEYEDYYEDYYDECDEYDRFEYRSNFVRPIFFDQLLMNFINNLSPTDLKQILMYELKKNEEYTFNNYLREDFERCSTDKNSIYAILEKMNKSFYILAHDYEYNDKDYTINLLSKNEKEKILSIYNKNMDMKEYIDKVILNPEIATYNDYKWIATLYKNMNTKADINNYTKKLESFFDTLKHYSIKNTIPKSNVLIAIYLWNDYSIEEIAKSIIKNYKYIEYVDYIIENIKNYNALYKKVNEMTENEKYLNNEYIARMYYKFYEITLDQKIYNKYLYYHFLYNKDISNLLQLKKSSEFDYYINKILQKTKDIIALETVYILLERKEALFNLLCSKENEYRLMANIEILKDDYNNQLQKYFEERFFEVVALEKSRDNYKKAAVYVRAIYKLNDGEKMVNELIRKLRNSEYSKRIALFDEIKKAIMC